MISADRTNAASNVVAGRHIRSFHRWVSILFTATVAMNFAVMAFATPPLWVTYSPLPPLFLLLGSGIFMLVKHYLPSAGKRGR